jgi:hypothetical protein
LRRVFFELGGLVEDEMGEVKIIYMEGELVKD